VPHYKVNVKGIQDRSGYPGQRKPYIVRWTVGGREFSESTRTKTEAKALRNKLFAAVGNGEEFDLAKGRPVAWLVRSTDASQVTVYEWARRYLSEAWPSWSPRTRRSALEAIARFVALAVRGDPSAAPLALRRYLAEALPPGFVASRADPCEKWLAANSLRLAELNEENLAAVDRALGQKLDGTPFAAETASRFRKQARACVLRARELKVLAHDPWPPPPRGRRHTKANRRRSAVDIRRLPDPATMARLLDAMVTYQPASERYRLMTAVAYYAGLRPSEVLVLRARSLELPAAGWGSIAVTEAHVDADEPGEPKTGPRTVPIPPNLVAMLREWIDAGDYDPDAHLFETRHGNLPTSSNWTRAWHAAARRADVPQLRIYDCRHAAATTWLRAGVSLGEAARRLGHSVETLVSTYVGALNSDEERSNQLIEQAIT
jgi:integrase